MISISQTKACEKKPDQNACFSVFPIRNAVKKAIMQEVHQGRKKLEIKELMRMIRKIISYLFKVKVEIIRFEVSFGDDKNKSSGNRPFSQSDNISS